MRCKFGTLVGTVKVTDRKWPVFCSFDGRFTALDLEVDQRAGTAGDWGITEIPDGVDVVAKDAVTMEAVEGQIRAALKRRKVKVAIPFRFHDGRNGTAYALHGGNGDAMVRDESGEVERLGVYYGSRGPNRTRGVFVHDIPDERIERFNEIGDEIRKLQAEQKEIEDWYSVNLQRLIAEEITSKLEARDQGTNNDPKETPAS